MNGWDEGHPSWWLNLKAHPDAIVQLSGESARPVRASEVAGERRDRLWQRWAAVNAELDGYAGLRSTQTPVIVVTARGGRAQHGHHLVAATATKSLSNGRALSVSGRGRSRVVRHCSRVQPALSRRWWRRVHRSC
jgi:hypothetical protein